MTKGGGLATITPRSQHPRRPSRSIDEAGFARADHHQRAHVGDGRVRVAKGRLNDLFVGPPDGAREGNRGRRGAAVAQQAERLMDLLRPSLRGRVE
jgi:hypothetical protein